MGVGEEFLFSVCSAQFVGNGSKSEGDMYFMLIVQL